VASIVAFIIHLADEIAGDAPAFYAPAIRALTGSELRFDVWLAVLALLVVILASLTAFVFQGVKALTYPVYIVAALMILNCLQHFALLVWFQRVTPGTRSAPLLFAASVWLLRETRRAPAA
jgi:Na+-transporting NADH:ubiquinone oxidoreductase subunit NqrD